MNSQTQYESFENRRKYPRLIMQIPVKVQNQHGLNLDARLHDISPDGLQIRCEQESAELIHPGGKQITKNTQASVVIGFRLPQNEASIEIIVRCSICYFVVLEDSGPDEVAFGLQFRQFEGDSLRHIKQFFLSEMEPA